MDVDPRALKHGIATYRRYFSSPVPVSLFTITWDPDKSVLGGRLHPSPHGMLVNGHSDSHT